MTLLVTRFSTGDTLLEQLMLQKVDLFKSTLKNTPERSGHQPFWHQHQSLLLSQWLS